jgi:hypothetical protein
MRQRRGALRGSRRCIHKTRNIIKAVFGHAPANDVERADPGQKVVEVVGDTAREVADRFHFLRLAQSFLSGGKFDFRLTLGCDVPAGTIDITLLRNANPRNPSIPAVLAAIPVGEPERGLSNLR